MFQEFAVGSIEAVLAILKGFFGSAIAVGQMQYGPEIAFAGSLLLFAGLLYLGRTTPKRKRKAKYDNRSKGIVKIGLGGVNPQDIPLIKRIVRGRFGIYAGDIKFRQENNRFVTLEIAGDKALVFRPPVLVNYLQQAGLTAYRHIAA